MKKYSFPHRRDFVPTQLVKQCERYRSIYLIVLTIKTMMNNKLSKEVLLPSDIPGAELSKP